MAGIKRALSVQQPYAELILRGELRHTRRSRPIKSIKERVYLYAAKQRAPASEWDRFGLDSSPPRFGQLGLIVGTVQVVGCESVGEDEYHWLLASPERLEPFEPSGTPGPGFWN